MADRADILFTKECVAGRVAALAEQISADYRGKELLVVGVLMGAFIFMADLIRGLTVPCCCDFVRLTSYTGTTSTGEIRIGKDLESPIAGRDVLVVEDIVDTGLTLDWLVRDLRKRGPASLRVCVFLDKPERRKVPFQADYVGFTIPDRFIVGYGLDYNEQYRYLPDVCLLREGA